MSGNVFNLDAEAAISYSTFTFSHRIIGTQHFVFLFFSKCLITNPIIRALPSLLPYVIPKWRLRLGQLAGISIIDMARFPIFIIYSLQQMYVAENVYANRRPTFCVFASLASAFFSIWLKYWLIRLVSS